MPSSNTCISDVPDPARSLLGTIPTWYNGGELDDRHIATDRPPKFNGVYQPAIDALQHHDLVRDERVLGTNVEWALTPRGCDVIAGLPGVDSIGECHESLRHRTGVAIVAHWLRQHRADIRAETVIEYPGAPDERCLDVVAFSDEHDCSLGFEVLTNQDEVGLYRRTIEHIRSGAAPERTAFVFPSRRVANTVLNRIDRSELTTIDIPNFPVENPSQWSFEKVQRYIAEGASEYGSHNTTGLPRQLYSYYSLFEQHTRDEGGD